MRRFFVNPGDLKESSTLELTGDEFHHLKNVCRLEVGERVELLDGEGGLARAEILNIEKKSAELSIISVSQIAELPYPHTEIILSIPRFQKMELIIQKCAELGATSITPVVSDRSFVKTISLDLESKIERWNKISNEACKQSGRAWPLKLKAPSKLQDELAVTSNGLFLFEGEGQTDIKTYLSELSARSVNTPIKNIRIFIGAEGGFSPAEVELFKNQNLKPVTLGPLVLRVETACISILSVIQYHFDLMR
jgi:16S rRNA (uracil1498-N3)-methyltransferase